MTLHLTGSVGIFDDPNRPDLVYDVTTGEVWLDPRDISTIGYYSLASQGAFLPENHTPLLGGLVTSLPYFIEEASLAGVFTTPQSIGRVLSPGMTFEEVSNVLIGSEAKAGLGAPNVNFDIDMICGDADCDGDILGDILTAFSNFTGPGTFSVMRFEGDVEGGPVGDDDIDSNDLLLMFANYTGSLDGPSALLRPAATTDLSIPDLIYDSATGEVILDVDGAGLIGYVLKTAAGTFLAGSHTQILEGVSTSRGGELSEVALDSVVAINSLGFVFPRGMIWPH